MTITSTTQRVTANGNDVATVFSFSPITIFASSELVVTLVEADGTETVLTEGTGSTNYSVSLTDSTNLPSTGSVTYPADEVTPLATGDSIVIKRQVALTQETDLENQGGYFPDTQENALDKLTMQSIQQQEEIDRSLKIAIGDADALSSVEFPEPAALKTIRWNATATALEEADDPTTAAAAAAASAAAALASETAAAASETNAATSETNAATSASNASTSETNAAASETNAATSETNAANDRAAIALDFTFDTTTSMADPGTGTVRFNSATMASVTAIAIDDLSADTGNPDVSAYITSWDDSTTTSKGVLIFKKLGDPSFFAVFTITGLTDNAGWTELAVTHVTGSTLPSASDSLAVAFSRTGDAGSGDISGPVSSTDHAVALWNGTGGKTLKDGPALGTSGHPLLSGGAASDPAFGQVDTAGIANDAVGLAQMASGTDGQLITYDASGNPVAVGPGTSGQVYTSNGAGAPGSFQDASVGGLTLGTEQATTSGSSVTFTGIPSGTTFIVVTFEGVTAGTNNNIAVRLGDSGGIETTGYVSNVSNHGSSTETTMILACDPAAGESSAYTGTVTLTLKDSTNFTWISSTTGFDFGSTPNVTIGGASKSLSAELTQVQVLTDGTFSAGSVNIAYQ